MKTLALIFGAAAIVFSAVSAAQASPFDFMFTSASGNGSGVLDVGTSSSPYSVTDISGIFNGNAITGISSYAGADNLLFYPSSTYVDFSGISFQTSAGEFNIYNQGNDYIISQVGNPAGYPADIPQNQLTAFTVTAAPEPATWALMIFGAGVVGGAFRRYSTKARSLTSVAA